MAYLIWNKKTITNFSDDNINSLYNNGYLFGRTGKGETYQTRSLRVDLSKFILSSENKRILRKGETIKLDAVNLPMANYHWQIGKLAKNFYTKKFGNGVFSANKIKEILTSEKSNFNKLFIFPNIGYCVCLETDKLLHYCYPFYSETGFNGPIGMIMMTKSVTRAKENNKKYVYLGSFSRQTDTYKLQFEGLEWFDGKEWKKDLDELKKNLQ